MMLTLKRLLKTSYRWHWQTLLVAFFVWIPVSLAFFSSESVRLTLRRERPSFGIVVVRTHSESNETPQSAIDWEGPKYDLSLLIIDHYDSFTYNLYDYFAQRLANPPTVIAKDAYDSWIQAVEDGSQKCLGEWDGIILSPGPGTPQEQPTLSHDAIRQNPQLPILGVCLGHQLLCLNYGAHVGKAPVPIHGQDHWIAQEITNTKGVPLSLFQDLPKSFRVVRYHSLAATQLPSCLQVTARSKDDQVIQGIQHTTYPHYGVQFHPESIGTQHGMALVDNFCKIVAYYKEQRTGDVARPTAATLPTTSSPQNTLSKPRFRVMVHSFHSHTQPVDVFEHLYANETYSVFLDSATAPTRGTIDILASPSQKDDVLEYHRHHTQTDILTCLQEELFGTDGKGSPSQQIAFVGEDMVFSDDMFVADSNVSGLPFHYRGGYLGYLGYEVRFDTEKYLHEIESGPPVDAVDSTSSMKTPTAAFFLARRSLVFHHPTQEWFLLGLIEDNDDASPMDMISWMQETKKEILHLSTKFSTTLTELPLLPEPNLRLPFVANRPKSTYERNINECHEYIQQGESYELCLTNQLEAQLKTFESTTWDLYKLLRRQNPAPYAGFFQWKGTGTENSVTICSSSPERFMSVKRQQPHPEIPVYLQAEAKPIKGTEARVLPQAQNGFQLTESEQREDERRARSLELSLKNRAENLMIVDLLRNDLSRVCRVGSVHVSKLMGIESFATVHQLVSTIRGTLREDSTTIDLLRASFPGGSMTGAPKLRTMELLEDLEERVDRGPYSGSLGYLSVNGCMDMNILIRSAVITGTETSGVRISVGAGGAITALSEAQDEYNEMLLKSRAVVQAVQAWAGPQQSNSLFQEKGRKMPLPKVTKNPIQ